MDKKLFNIARKFHERCATHSVNICTGKLSRGISFPKSKAERKLLTAKIRFELSWTEALAYFEGFNSDTVIKAIETYDKYFKIGGLNG